MLDPTYIRSPQALEQIARVEGLPSLLEKIVKLQLYAIFMTPTDRWRQEGQRVVEVLYEHLVWLKKVESQGILFASGPFDQTEDYWPGSGLAIVRAESLEAAQQLAQQEPFHREGLRENTVRSWQLNEGSLTLTVHLLNGALQLT